MSVLRRATLLSVIGFARGYNLAAPLRTVATSRRAPVVRLADDEFDDVKPSTVFSERQ